MSARRILIVPVASALVLVAMLAHGAAAQPATGTVTGRVLWGNCLRAIPLPAVPEAQGQPAMPQPAQPPATGLPAGAVLVALQSTAISARTDEAGSFILSGVPAGQYLTVAAGPVANAPSAIAERPNVFVSGGQSVDVGVLNLGGSPTAFGVPCRVVPGVEGGPPPDTTSPQPSPDVISPDTTTPNP